MNLNDPKNITIEDLLHTMQISVRAYNACLKSRLVTLDQILAYFLEKRSFTGLAKVGRLTNLELEAFCKQRLTNLSQVPVIKQVKNDFNRVRNEIKYVPLEILEIKQTFESLSQEQIDILDYNFKERLSMLEVRCRHAIPDKSVISFYNNFIVDVENSFSNLANVGKHTIQSLETLREQVKEDIKRLSEYTPEQIFMEHETLKYGSSCNNPFLFNFYETYKHLPMFWIINQRVEHGSERNMDILKSTLPFLHNQQILTLGDMADKHKITRERARQIRFAALGDYFGDRSRFIRYRADWFYYANYFSERTVISVTDPFFPQCNQQEKCMFTPEFYLQALAMCMPSSHCLFGGFLDQFQWRKPFLIRKDLCDCFDFNKFYNGAAERFAQPLNYDIEFDLLDFLYNKSQSWKRFNASKVGEISDVIAQIFLDVYNVKRNPDGKLLIVSNRPFHTPYMEVYQILYDNGSPMHLNEIFTEFKKRFPNHRFTHAAQLRPALALHEGIGYIGRSSTYTLLEWKHIKAGTIRGAIIEFLNSKDIPQGKKAISDYVIPYFPHTNPDSITTTMYADTRHRFVFFKNGLYGLRSKKYPRIYEEIEELSSQRRRLNAFGY